MAKSVKIQASRGAINSVSAGSDVLDTTKKLERHTPILLTTGAKAYYLGGGWWRISGYAQSELDVDDIVTRLYRANQLCGPSRHLNITIKE